MIAQENAERGFKMKIVQLQTRTYSDKAKNLAELERYLESIKEEKVDFVMLGEIFNCPYGASNFSIYAEEEGGESWLASSQLAKKYKVYLSAGTIPERGADGNIYNTAYVFNRNGEQIAKHRKMHLFDVDIKGGLCFKESETLTAGNDVTVFDTEFGKMGLCICFDCRFPELGSLMVQKGAKMILVPAAFNMTTGPAHWDIMFRCRALDNQCYMVGTSVARDETAEYVAWGHSLLVSPWGNIVEQLDEKEGMLISDIDLAYVDKIREELPLLSARRMDVYSITEK